MEPLKQVILRALQEKQVAIEKDQYTDHQLYDLLNRLNGTLVPADTLETKSRRDLEESGIDFTKDVMKYLFVGWVVCDMIKTPTDNPQPEQKE